MASINVGQLDDRVVARLKHRAASNRRSLEGEVRRILERVAEDDIAARRARFLARSDPLWRKTQGRSHTPAEALIRADRDHGHHAN